MRCLAVAALLGVVATRDAHAAPAEPDALDELYAQAHPQPHPIPANLTFANMTWYGWQTLLVDALFIVPLATGPLWAHFEGAGWLLAIDAIAGFVATPIIHALHGNREGCALSLSLRLVVPTIATLTGLLLGESLRSELHVGSPR